MSLTPEQFAVIKEPDENKLICALPGSGKTHTTVSLAEAILQSPNAKILMVTFTNASAVEMQNRVAKRLSAKEASRVTAKTFAKVFLGQHRPLSNNRKLVLGGEFKAYLIRAMQNLGVNLKQFPDAERAMDEIGRDLTWSHSGDYWDDLYTELQNLLAIYHRVDLNTVCKEVIYGLIDGQIKPLNYTHILIDEFQDTDDVQLQWMLLHKSPNRYFTVVGDDDQSIYSFRGACGYKNMVTFKREFSATAYLLSTCFRCAPLILGRGQHLIEHNQQRIQKDMHSAKSDLGKVYSLVYTREYISPFTKMLEDADNIDGIDKNRTNMKKPEEYRFVVDHIINDYNDWAVLARTNLHLDELEKALSERGIPAIRLGGKSIYDSPNVLGVIKLLYGICNPKQIDVLIEGLAWLGESEQSLQSILYSAKKVGFTGLSDVSSRWDEPAQEIYKLAMRLAHNRSDEQLKIGFMDTCLDVITKVQVNLNHADIKARASAMLLVNKILSSMQGDLFERTETIYKLSQGSTRKNNQADMEGKIVLSTMTGAKGLEWPKVLLMNVNDKVIPSLKDAPEDSEMLLAKIEEERRLLYVGITRAESELAIHYHLDSPSMFIPELGTLLTNVELEEYSNKQTA